MHTLNLVYVESDIVPLGRAYFGEGSGNIFLDEILCTGDEERLSDCHHEAGNSHDCTHAEDAGVRCGGEFSM